MTENKLKHLEFIQNIISRMNSNSFLIKGWTITLLSALIALSISSEIKNLVYVGFMVITIFWILDGFFISRERLFRDLYNEVAQTQDSEIDFKMDISKFRNTKTTWVVGVFSKTLIPIYLIMYSSLISIILLTN